MMTAVSEESMRVRTGMASATVAATMAVAALAVAGCGPRVKPGLGVTGDKTVARFDRPMVAADQLGRDVADPPLRVKPAVPGKFRWRDVQTLAFEAAQPLPRSTRFEMTVRAGTRALDGFGVAKAVTWSFETERLRVRLFAPTRWATPDQDVTLRFNQPVRSSEVAKRCAYVRDGKRVAAAVEEGKAKPTDEAQGEGESGTKAPADDARSDYVVRPREALALATKWRFVCSADLVGTEGPLGLAVESEESKGNKRASRLRSRAGGKDASKEAPNELAFETYGPFKVDAIEPAGEEVSPDDQSIVITFSNPIDTAAFDTGYDEDDGQGESPGESSDAPGGDGDGDRGLPITIDPPIKGFPRRAHAYEERVSFGVRALKPRTRYTITIDGALTDKFGQKLPGRHVATFSTGDGTPRLDVETGEWVVEAARTGYPVWARNLTKIEADVAPVPEAKLSALAQQISWWDEKTVDAKKLGLKLTRATIPVQGRKNQWDQVAIEPAKLLGAGARSTGFYYVALRAPEEPAPPKDEPPPTARELLLNFTNLGVTAKMSGPSGLVWVTRLSDGQVQPGVEVTIRDRKGKVRWRGTTDADGVAVTPGYAQLAPTGKSGRRSGDGDPEAMVDAELDRSAGNDAEVLVFARLGEDVTWVDPRRAGGFAAWNFHVSSETSSRADQLRGFLHTDRGLYRPGDTVRVKGLARLMRLGGALRLPSSRKVHVVVRDPRGEPLLERNVAMTRFGGFSVDVPIDEAARLGDYRVEASMAEGVFHERFSVEQYRAATFEVKVARPAREPVAGEMVRLSAEARYLYGSPLRNGSLTWRVYRRSREVSFEDFPRYQFGDARQWESWADSLSGGAELPVTEKEQSLDKNGRGKLSLKLERDDFRSPQDLMVTAEVQDETHQTIAANIAVHTHQAAVYFGLDRGSPIGEAKGARTVQLIAVDPKGARVAAEGTFRAVRRDWSCAWEAWGYHGGYRCEKKDKEVMRQTVAITSEAPSAVKFTPPGSGEYQLIVEGRDRAGNATASSTYFYSWGATDDAGSWQASDDARFELIPDKNKYKVGETARLLLKTTVRNATALLTVERDGVIEKRRFAIGGGTSTVEVPIKEGYGPNVFASVLLVKGRTAKGPHGVPVIRMGLATLPVDTDAKRLTVEVATDKPSYRPGETVTANIRVADAGGKPVQAELSLAAADEGVLTLIAFKTPDPLATFYASWGLGVTTASQYERVARLPEPGAERFTGGGDGAGAPGTFRSRFLATAYWNPAVETDAEGRARVTFQAPDNLTAYRLMAVAADAGERFGSGEQRLTVRKPLQILSGMPRFLNVGDDAKGSVLVVNETGQAGTAIVDATVTGARLRGGAHQEVAVPANGRVPIHLPISAERAGELRLRVKAVLGNESDGLELRIPIHTPARLETELVAEGSTTSAVDIPVKLPAGVLPSTVSLEVSTDPDGIAGLEEGLRDLIEYPYGCLEQTTSRLIPLVAVEELAKSLKLAGLDGPSLQGFIRAGLAKVQRFQTEEGGFSLWVGGAPELYVTAFALWGLKVASDAGHKVPPAVVSRGVGWLRRQLGTDVKAGQGEPVHNELGELGSRAFALHVLGMLEKPESGYANRLLEKKAALPRFGKAFLARALALDLGAQHPAVTGLLDELAGAAVTKGKAGTNVLIPEPNHDDLAWYMSDDVRTTAIATDAFLDLRPSEPLLPKLVRGLFAERREGRWATTQDNLYALVALTHYVKSRAAGSVSVVASLGDKQVLSGELRGAGARIRRASIPLDPARPPGAPLTIRATGGEVFYASVLRFRRDLAHQKPYENRLTVRREYLDPATDKPIDLQSGKGLKVGSMVRVRVTFSSPEWRNHLAIDDPLPAGLEALNTKLVTSGGVPAARRRGHARDGDDDGDEVEDLDESWRPSFREVRDDRVLVFIDGVEAGPVSFDYLARATTAGSFVIQGTSVEEMYQPEIAARAAPSRFVVRE